MPRQRSRLMDEEDQLRRLKRAFSTTKLGAGGAADLSRLLGDPTEFGMTRAPAHALRAERIAERMRTVPVMGPTDGPGQAVGAPTAVREGGFLERNVHPIAAALGQAGQAVMGRHQGTWQARLGASAQQLAETRAYQETVSAVLGGASIEDIPAARTLRPEQFSAVMTMKAEADKSRFDKEDRLYKRQRELDKDLKAGTINERDYKQRLEEFRANLGLAGRRVAATELQAKTAAAREAKIPTPEEEARLRLDFEKGLEEIKAPAREAAQLQGQLFSLYSKLMTEGYTTEEAMEIVNGYAARVEAGPAGAGEAAAAVEEPEATSYQAPGAITSEAELEAAGPGFWKAGTDVVEKDEEGVVWTLDSAGKRLHKYGEEGPEPKREVIFDIPEALGNVVDWLRKKRAGGRKLKPDEERFVSEADKLYSEYLREGSKK